MSDESEMDAATERDRDIYERYLMCSAETEHRAAPEHPTIQ